MTQQLRSADYWQQLTSEKHLSLYYIIQKGHRLFFKNHPCFRTASSQTFKEDWGHRAEKENVNLFPKSSSNFPLFGHSNHLCCLGMFPLGLGKMSDAKPASLVSSCAQLQLADEVCGVSRTSVFPLGECCALPTYPWKADFLQEIMEGDMELLERGQWRATEMVKGLEHLPDEERLRKRGDTAEN